MRFKPVPPCRGVDFLADVQRALPLVPAGANDCCTRVSRRTDVPDEGAAREWLTFCRALGLAERTEEGFVRTDREPTPENLREPFLERVFGAREVLNALADSPKPESAVFEALESRVSGWERGRHADWERTWNDRAANLLEWAVAFGLARKEGETYAPAT